MSFDRLKYEVRLMGKKVTLTPILVMLAIGLLAGILYGVHEKVSATRLLTASLEMLLPLAAGFVVAVICTQDPAIELQLTMPQKYHLTAIGRLIFIAAWSACIALIASSILFVLNMWWGPLQLQSWSNTLQFIVGQLTWLAPLLWFVAVALCLSLLMHSRAGSTTVLGGIWVLELTLYEFFIPTPWLRAVFLFPTTITPGVDFWLLNRVELIITAIILLPLGWLLLYNTEGLLKGSSEE